MYILFVMLPIIEFGIDILGIMIIWLSTQILKMLFWLFRKIIKFSIIFYISSIGFVWGVIIYRVLYDIYIQAANNQFEPSSANIHNISKTAIENLFNQSVQMIKSKY